MIVVIKNVGEEPKVSEIANDYKALRDAVGGYIEIVRLPRYRDICIVCNEEGKLLGLEPNFLLREYRDIICGNVVFAGDDGCGDFRSLTEEEIKIVKDYIG